MVMPSPQKKNYRWHIITTAQPAGRNISFAQSCAFKLTEIGRQVPMAREERHCLENTFLEYSVFHIPSSLSVSFKRRDDFGTLSSSSSIKNNNENII